MRKLTYIISTLALALSLAALAGQAAQAAGTCPVFDTGHLSANDAKSTTITAPAGQVIVAVCVKAGSAQQDLGPETTTFSPGVTSATISHSSGKEISHYSVDYAAPVTSTPTPGTTPTTPGPGPSATPVGPNVPVPSPSVGGPGAPDVPAAAVPEAGVGAEAAEGQEGGPAVAAEEDGTTPSGELPRTGGPLVPAAVIAGLLFAVAIALKFMGRNRAA